MLHRQFRFLCCLLMFLVQPKIVGREHIPTRGCFIPICNHFSAADYFALASIFDQRLGVVVKDDNHPRMKQLIALLVGSIFIKRRRMGNGPQSVRVDLGAYKAIIRCQKSGRPVLFFLPGTRSTTQQIGRVSPHEARWVANFGIPILPIGISGTWDIERGNRPHLILIEVLKFVLGIRKVTVRIGEPIESLPKGRDQAQTAADMIGWEIAQLVNRGHRGTYEKVKMR